MSHGCNVNGYDIYQNNFILEIWTDVVNLTITKINTLNTEIIAIMSETGMINIRRSQSDSVSLQK